MTQLPAINEPPFVVAVDIGSSSVRAALYYASARRVDGLDVRADHSIHTTSSGAAEEFADHLIENIEHALDRLLELSGDLSGHIAGVGVDSMASTVLGVDSDGRVVTPIYTYADTRSKDYVERLKDDLNIESVYHRTGTPQHTSYWPSRLHWLRDTQPEVYNRVHRWMDAGTFLYTRWFDDLDVPTSYSMASWTGMLNRHRLEWDVCLLNHLSVKNESMQPLAAYSSYRKGLAKPFSERWPALKDVPFFLAVGDGISANVGSGCASPKQMALTVGTSGAMRILVDGEIGQLPYGLWAYRLGCDRTLLGGAFSDGGSLFSWAKSTLNLPPDKTLESCLQSSAPDGHGLTILPFLSGERSTGWASSALGTIHGLTTSTTPLEILQAGLESVAYRFADVHDMLKDFAGDGYEIVASGGAIVNSQYRLQLMADVLQHPVTVCTEEEATGRGTAILALHALGVWASLEEAPLPKGSVYEPDAERGAIYENAFERQQKLYDLVIGKDTEVWRLRRLGNEII